MNGLDGENRCLLDHSATFNTINPSILLDHLPSLELRALVYNSSAPYEVSNSSGNNESGWPSGWSLVWYLRVWFSLPRLSICLETEYHQYAAEVISSYTLSFWAGPTWSSWFWRLLVWITWNKLKLNSNRKEMLFCSGFNTRQNSIPLKQKFYNLEFFQVSWLTAGGAGGGHGAFALFWVMCLLCPTRNWKP